MTNETTKSRNEELSDLVQRGYRFAYSLTHNAGRADDLVQDAWLAVLRASGPWTIEYLFRTIRSRFVDRCRREAIVTFEPLDFDMDGSDFRFKALDATTDGDGEYEPVSGGMADALARLRPEERAALYLSAVEDYTAQQIADFFGWPRGTVLSLIHRARLKLQQWVPTRPGAST